MQPGAANPEMAIWGNHATHVDVQNQNWCLHAEESTDVVGKHYLRPVLPPLELVDKQTHDLQWKQ